MTLLASAGCGDDTAPDRICKYVYDPMHCVDEGGLETGEEGAEDGDGDGDGDDDGAAFIEPCLLVADGTPRTVMQCNGSLSASISFDTLLGDCGNTLGDPGWCDEVHDFGVGFDDYTRPAVMACCDPETAGEGEVLRYCAVDLVEQVCRSVPKRLQMLIDEGLIKLGAKQAGALRDWLNKHQQDCFAVFNAQAETPGLLESRSWLVNAGNNADWPMLRNFTITVDSAQVYSATVPDGADERIACDDPNFNNTEIFEETVPVSPGIHDVTQLAGLTSAALTGPELFGSRVIGDATLASRADCAEPRCSTLALSEDMAGGRWAVDELSLYASGDVTLKSGELELAVSGAALRLYGVSHGRIDWAGRVEASYVIEPGAAHFLVSGESQRLRDARWATNTTAIKARKSEIGWIFAGFAVTHIDGAGDSWTISIPSTTWN